MWPSQTDEIYEFLEEIDENMQEMQKELKEIRKKLDRVLTLYTPPEAPKS